MRKCVHKVRVTHTVLHVVLTPNFKTTLESVWLPLHAWAMCIANKSLVYCR